MSLRLSVVSEHGIRLGTTASNWVFGVHGGSIGRGTDNEWILPDPERYLSGKHARVEFRAGSYVLVDTSSNGTFVNGAHMPLGKQHDHLLEDGDCIRLGDYELRVHIEQGNDLVEDLDLSQLLEASDQSLRLAGQRATTPDAAEEAGGTPWHMLTRPLKVESEPAAGAPARDGVVADTAQPPMPASRAPLPAAPSPALHGGDLDAGLAAFCRGAGLDPRSISPEARAAALHLAGRLLRESVLGLIDLDADREEFRQRFRIPQHADDGPESPLNFSRGVDDLLLCLLTTASIRAGSVEAIRHNFRELKAQSGASLTAMHAAFEEFVGRLNPKELEERFDRASKRGVFGTPNKGKYWDLYAEMFRGLTQRPTDGFPHLFMEAFAKAYEARLRTLVPPRRSAFGADRNDGDP